MRHMAIMSRAGCTVIAYVIPANTATAGASLVWSARRNAVASAAWNSPV
jgi:hypothetical protein